MKEEQFILMFMGWALLIMGIILIFCQVKYKTDETLKKIDQLEDSVSRLASAGDGSATATDAEKATLTDASPSDTEALPAEPTDDEIVVDLIEAYKEDETATTAEATEEIEVEEATPAEPVLEYAGNYELTAYIATGNPCADGVFPSVGFTVASNDPKLWHKYIEIEGYGTFYVHDTGGMSSNVIDIFVASYDEAIQFGRRSADVYIKD